MARAANPGDTQRASRARGNRLAFLSPAVLTGALVPLVDMTVRAARGTLGANPIAEALNRLGLLALIFLLASLACTPLRLWFGWAWPARIRRLLGLLAFSYALLHVLTYALLDQLGDVRAMVRDVLERPFITVGLLAFALLVPLATTSTPDMIKRLGAARWRKLHRLAYVAAVLGVVHFFFRVKQDVSEPLRYALVLALLFAARFVHARGRRGRS